MRAKLSFGCLVVLMVGLFQSSLAFSMLKEANFRCPLPDKLYTDMINTVEALAKEINRGGPCTSIGRSLDQLKALHNKANIDMIVSIFKGQEPPKPPTKDDKKGDKKDGKKNGGITGMGTKDKDKDKDKKKNKLAKDDNDDGDNALTDSRLTQLTDFSRQVTTGVWGIINALKNRPACLNKKSTSSFLSKMANVVLGASNVAGTLAGPKYGIPIQIGGKALGGILQGIDQIAKDNKYRHNFKLAADRRFYISKLCVYHHLRGQLSLYIHPKVGISKMTKVSTKIKGQMTSLKAKNTDLNRYVQLSGQVGALKEMNEDFKAKKNLLKFSGPRPKCQAIAGMVYGKHSYKVRYQQKSLTKSDQLNSLLFKLQSQNKVWAASKCLDAKTPITEVVKVGLASLKIVEDTLKNELQRVIGALGIIKLQARNSKALSKAIKTYDAKVSMLAWAKKEKEKYVRMSQSNSNNARADLTDMKANLEKRLIDRLAPNFLKYIYRNGWWSYRYYAARSGYYRTRWGAFTGWQRYFKYIKGWPKGPRKSKKVKRVYYSIGKALHYYKRANFRFKTLKQFCEYYRAISKVTRYTDRWCDKIPYLKSIIYKRIAVRNVRLAFAFRKWARENGYVYIEGAQSKQKIQEKTPVKTPAKKPAKKPEKTKKK